MCVIYIYYIYNYMCIYIYVYLDVPVSSNTNFNVEQCTNDCNNNYPRGFTSHPGLATGNQNIRVENHPT